MIKKFLVIFVIFQLFLRFYTFPDIIDMKQTDVHRDYLIANHIVSFHEYPLTGPQNSFSTFRNSPIYYYILAAFLLIYNHFLFLQVVNIVFQVCSIVLLYILYRKFASQYVSLAGVLLYTTSYAFLSHSFYMWQPYLMEPVLIGAYIYFADFVQKRKIKYLYISGMLFSLALALHMSVIPVFISLIFIAIYLLRHNTNTILRFLVYTTILMIVLFLPTFLIFVSNKLYLSMNSSYFLDNRFSLFIIGDKLISNIVYFFRNSFFEFNNILLTLTLASFTGYWFRKDKQRIVISMMYAIFVFHFVVLSIYSKASFSHYYIPVLPIYFFLLAYTWDVIVAKLMYSRYLYSAVVTLLIYIFSINGISLIPRTADITYHEFNKGVEVISNKISQLEKKDHTVKQKYQVIIIWRDEFYFPWYEAPFFIHQLEKQSGSPLVRVSNTDNNIQILNSNDYIFVLCEESINVAKCLPKVSKLVKGYSKKETLYDKNDYQLFFYEKIN